MRPTDEADVLGMHAVMSAPASEAAVREAAFAPGARQVVHPDLAAPSTRVVLVGGARRAEAELAACDPRITGVETVITHRAPLAAVIDFKSAVRA